VEASWKHPEESWSVELRNCLRRSDSRAIALLAAYCASILDETLAKALAADGTVGACGEGVI